MRLVQCHAALLIRHAERAGTGHRKSSRYVERRAVSELCHIPSDALANAAIYLALRVYARYLPESAQRDVDRPDEAMPAHPNASQAHPETATTDDVIAAKSFVVSGEPRRNRTFNPQIKSLLLCQLS